MERKKKHYEGKSQERNAILGALQEKEFTFLPLKLPLILAAVN